MLRPRWSRRSWLGTTGTERFPYDGAVTVPNVLATRYAAPDLVAIWSPEHKAVLERRLWIAVLTAQRDLGVDVPDGVFDAY